MGKIDGYAPARAARMASLLLNRHSPQEIADAIEILVDVLDMMGGDPETEDNGDAELTGDERDSAWVEWHTMRGSQKRGPNIMDRHEDDEDDDPAEDDDPSGVWASEDEPEGFAVLMGSMGPGCPISDPVDDHGRIRGGSDAA